MRRNRENIVYALVRAFGNYITLDMLLFVMTLLFAGVGLLTLYSASDVFPTRFEAQIKNWILAFVLMFFVAQIKPKLLLHLAVPMYILGVFLLVGVEFVGETRKGATRWLSLGFFSIQPSELMKIAVPMMLAWWFHQRERSQPLANFVIASVLLLIPVYLILIEPDLGTALLVMAAGLSVLVFAGLSWKLIVPPVLLGLVGLGVLFINQEQWCTTGFDWYFLHDYQVKRVCTLFNPEVDPRGGGFHILQSTIAIGSGGITGKGFMQGTQAHLNFIPESTTDFIFAVYAEEFGLLGNGLLLLLYLFLLWRGLYIAAQARSRFSRLLAGGITSIFFVCVFVNLGMVSGILPVVGIPLPFMSYGGTALISFMIGIGILMSIAGESKKAEKSHRRPFGE